MQIPCAALRDASQLFVHQPVIGKASECNFCVLLMFGWAFFSLLLFCSFSLAVCFCIHGHHHHQFSTQFSRRVRERLVSESERTSEWVRAQTHAIDIQRHRRGSCKFVVVFFSLFRMILCTATTYIAHFSNASGPVIYFRLQTTHNTQKEFCVRPFIRSLGLFHAQIGDMATDVSATATVAAAAAVAAAVVVAATIATYYATNTHIVIDARPMQRTSQHTCMHALIKLKHFWLANLLNIKEHFMTVCIFAQTQNPLLDSSIFFFNRSIMLCRCALKSRHHLKFCENIAANSNDSIFFLVGWWFCCVYNDILFFFPVK